MKIKDESFTIVLAGNWNKYILQPNWVAKEIFEETTVQLEFAVNIGLPPRYTASNIRIIPTDEKVTFRAMDTSDNCLTKMGNMAIKLLNKLNYTPISAFGMNFGYTEKAETQNLFNLFKFADNDELGSFGCIINNSLTQKNITIDERILNLKIHHIGKDVSFDFNFHYDVGNASEAEEKIKENVLKNKKIAEDILNKVYKLSFETAKEVTE